MGGLERLNKNGGFDEYGDLPKSSNQPRIEWFE